MKYRSLEQLVEIIVIIIMRRRRSKKEIDRWCFLLSVSNSWRDRSISNWHLVRLYSILRCKKVTLDNTVMDSFIYIYVYILIYTHDFDIAKG